MKPVCISKKVLFVSDLLNKLFGLLWSRLNMHHRNTDILLPFHRFPTRFLPCFPSPTRCMNPAHRQNFRRITATPSEKLANTDHRQNRTTPLGISQGADEHFFQIERGTLQKLYFLITNILESKTDFAITQKIS